MTLPHPKALTWLPEPYPRTGGLAAEGFYKLLGRPRLDPLAVLVRETAQNSWDARRRNASPVLFRLDGRHFGPEQRQILQEEVFPGAPRINGSPLGDVLASPGLLGLEISDRNTLGLGGPVSADQASSDDVYDWVDFVLNVGKANTQGMTGGTYGFGKTISYVVSEANAVVIHSRSRVEGRSQSRLIACAIGTEFALDGRKYTGRHWWGAQRDTDAHGGPVPLIGTAADELAERIGMRPFSGDDDLGTNLLIVGPDLGGRTPSEAMNYLVEAVLWHLWPKTLSRSDRQGMDIAVSWQGESLRFPRLSERPPLDAFAAALDAALDPAGPASENPGLQVTDIRCGNPNTVVGRLAMLPTVRKRRAVVEDGGDRDDDERPDPAAMIGEVAHHTALLRAPDLVVEYLEGPPAPEGTMEWVGVFRVQDEHDAHFARSEPPTHDSWEPSLLEKGRARTIVNVGLRRVREAVSARWRPKSHAADAGAVSTANVARELSHLVGLSEAKGPGRRRAPAAPPSRSKDPIVRLRSSRPVILGDGSVGTGTSWVVSPAIGSTLTSLEVSVAVALEGGKRDALLDPLLSLVSLTVNGADHPVAGLRAECSVESAVDFEVELLAQRSRDYSILFDVEAEAG